MQLPLLQLLAKVLHAQPPCQRRPGLPGCDQHALLHLRPFQLPPAASTAHSDAADYLPKQHEVGKYCQSSREKPAEKVQHMSDIHHLQERLFSMRAREERFWHCKSLKAFPATGACLTSFAGRQALMVQGQTCAPSICSCSSRGALISHHQHQALSMQACQKAAQVATKAVFSSTK